MTTGTTAALDSSIPSTTHSSRSSSTSRPSLSLDLSNLPPLSHPSPPSNTLLITDLNDLHIFQPSSLATIRSKMNDIAPLNSFSPLPSLRRIVCSFHSTDDAVRVRQNIEMSSNFLNIKKAGIRIRVYFGEHTPIEGTEEARRGKLLEAPQSQKLFFISPPPSPPAGWVMRNEEPPNKEVHATDLAEALALLRTEHQLQNAADAMATDPVSPVSISEETHGGAGAGAGGSTGSGKAMATTRTPSWPLNNNNNNTSGSGSGSAGRSRSSTLIYHPSDHGGSPNLPAVMVEDTSVEWRQEEDGDGDIEMDMDNNSPLEIGGGVKRIFAHTARPPVELMH